MGHKILNWAEKIVRDKCSNLLVGSLSDEEKKFHNIYNRWQFHKNALYHIMILIYFTVGSTSSGLAFVIAPNLGAKILSEYFTGNAPPLYILDLLL